MNEYLAATLSYLAVFAAGFALGNLYHNYYETKIICCPCPTPIKQPETMCIKWNIEQAPGTSVQQKQCILWARRPLNKM